MKKKNAKNEYEEMLSFIDSLIDAKENEIDCLINACSDLYHEVRAREMLLNEKKQVSSSNNYLFSPNDSGKLSYFDDEWLSQLDSMKKLHDEKMKLLKEAQAIQEKQKRLKVLLSSNGDFNVIDHNEDLDITHESNLQSLAIQEMERNRIANDLHDSAVQNLTGLVHKGELCLRLFDLDPIRARMEMSSIIDVARETIDDIRSSIFELRPASIDDFGLPAAIEDYCNHINPDRKFFFTINVEGEEPELPNSILVTLYRICQEACINIVKHSNASKVDIIIKYDEDAVTLTVSDNGIGVSQEKLYEAVRSKSHFGLKILKERAKLVNGELIINNKKEGGLMIQVTIPIAKRGTYD